MPDGSSTTIAAGASSARSQRERASLTAAANVGPPASPGSCGRSTGRFRSGSNAASAQIVDPLRVTVCPAAPSTVARSVSGARRTPSPLSRSLRCSASASSGPTSP